MSCQYIVISVQLREFKMTFCSVNLCIVSLRMQNVTLFYNRDRQRTLLLNVFFYFPRFKNIFGVFIFFSIFASIADCCVEVGVTERCIRGCGDDSGLSAIHDLDSDCAAELPKILHCASGLSVCRHKTSSQLTSVTSLCSATYVR